MQCPKCGRQTRKRLRGGEDDGSGVLQAATAEGHCYRDYAPTVGPARDGVRQRDRHPRMRATEDELNQAAAAILRYWGRRRARGVPADGLDPESLDRPGLFLMEVR